jgi:uncharacterized protein involved in response to NO
MAESPPILRGGFRPFFLGAAGWALTVLALWLLALAGTIQLPTAVDPLSWHRHEMLFGFIGAAITGFLLTAIPNWTGRLPIAGAPLAGLFVVWVAARLALLFSAIVGLAPAAVLDVGFFVLVASLAAREVLAAKNRNLPIVLLLLLFATANGADYLGMAGLSAQTGVGTRGGLALVIVMISLIGGRIVPSFTRNWLAKQGVTDGLPGQPTRFDLLVIGATVAALAGWVAVPAAGIVAPLLVGAGMLQAVRLSRWKGWRTVRDPLVVVLHVGYLWVPVGLVLLGSSSVATLLPTSAAIHALTAGAMATMILAVMTRATLGHTGRDLRADAATTLIYILVTLGALLRVTAPAGLLDYELGLWLSGIGWGSAFLLFILVYGPILARPHASDRAR